MSSPPYGRYVRVMGWIIPGILLFGVYAVFMLRLAGQTQRPPPPHRRQTPPQPAIGEIEIIGQALEVPGHGITLIIYRGSR